MTEELVVEVLSEAFYTTFTILLPILGASLMIGIFHIHFSGSNINSGNDFNFRSQNIGNSNRYTFPYTLDDKQTDFFYF